VDERFARFEFVTVFFPAGLRALAVGFFAVAVVATGFFGARLFTAAFFTADFLVTFFALALRAGAFFLRVKYALMGSK
jgi:hypothetical protein